MRRAWGLPAGRPTGAPAQRRSPERLTVQSGSLETASTLQAGRFFLLADSVTVAILDDTVEILKMAQMFDKHNCFFYVTQCGGNSVLCQRHFVRPRPTSLCSGHRYCPTRGTDEEAGLGRPARGGRGPAGPMWPGAGALAALCPFRVTAALVPQDLLRPCAVTLPFPLGDALCR